MSSFVVEDKTIAKVLCYVWQQTQSGGRPRRAGRALVEAGHALTPPALRILGQQMLTLNRRATDTRYSEDNPVDRFEFRPTFVKPVAAYKALRCWLYQCAEGEVVDHPLYRLFSDRVAPAIAQDIVEDSPEYDAAPWG